MYDPTHQLLHEVMNVYMHDTSGYAPRARWLVVRGWRRESRCRPHHIGWTSAFILHSGRHSLIRVFHRIILSWMSQGGQGAGVYGVLDGCIGRLHRNLWFRRRCKVNGHIFRDGVWGVALRRLGELALDVFRAAALASGAFDCLTLEIQLVPWA